MTPKYLVVIFAAVLSNPASVLANAAQAQEPRAGQVCGSGIYKELAPILAGFPVAQTFCTAVYPIKHANWVRSRSTSPPSTKTTTTTATKNATTKPPTTTTDVRASAWAKCQAQGANVVSTMCSCIQASPKACSKLTKSSSTTKTKKASTTTTKTKKALTTSTTTKTKSISTATSSTTSSTTSAPAPAHTIDAPRCDPATANDVFINGGCSDQCTCEPDVEGDYYCGTSTDNVSCDLNEDCPQGQYCAANSVSCNSGTDPGDECTSVFDPGANRSLNRLRMGRMLRRGPV